MADFVFEMKKHMGTIATSQKGWTKELNFVSWNEKEPKFDIREWSPDHKRMGRGVTLTEEELLTLKEILVTSDFK